MQEYYPQCCGIEVEGYMNLSAGDERTAASLYLPDNDVQGFLHPRYDFTGDLWLGLIGMGLEADLR